MVLSLAEVSLKRIPPLLECTHEVCTRFVVWCFVLWFGIVNFTRVPFLSHHCYCGNHIRIQFFPMPVNEEQRIWVNKSRGLTNFIETEMSSFGWNFCQWLYRKLSFWQLLVQPVMKISTKWWHFRFSVSNNHSKTKVWQNHMDILWDIL